jgi:hypothetical protein
LSVRRFSHGAAPDRCGICHIPLTCALALAIFATGIAVSVLLIAAYSRPFTGEISVGPQLLQQVIATEPPDGGP